ncbi:hypothetical protein R0J90_19060, partial [Micrococcus sp. SIMBA_144]
MREFGDHEVESGIEHAERFGGGEHRTAVSLGCGQGSDLVRGEVSLGDYTGRSCLENQAKPDGIIELARVDPLIG